MSSLTNEEIKDLLYNMLKARRFEEKLQEMSRKGQLYGTCHLGIGQEASGVGAALAALHDGDLAILTHRGHNQTIGMGADLSVLMGEMLGKEQGCAGGRGGSMHFFDLEHGNYGETGVVGGTYPIACGMAFTQVYKKTGKAVLCCSGDGSVNTGNFHESLNIASVMKLPVVFFIENNLYAMSTPVENTMSVISLSDRAQAYGIPGMTIDGNDALEVYEIVTKALEYAKSGEGPFLIEALTYRQCGHSKNDDQCYRSQQEVDNWRQEDPIYRLSEYMKENHLATEAELYELERKAFDDVLVALNKAQDMDEAKVQNVDRFVYAE